MEKKNQLNDMMHSAMEKVREMVDTNTIVGQPITTPDGVGRRNLVSLMVSDDMTEWELVADLIDVREKDPLGRKVGYQYIDFFYEGNDILFLCRTGDNNAANMHDTNYMTFHRVSDFRKVLAK